MGNIQRTTTASKCNNNHKARLQISAIIKRIWTTQIGPTKTLQIKKIHISTKKWTENRPLGPPPLSLNGGESYALRNQITIKDSISAIVEIHCQETSSPFLRFPCLLK